MSVNLRLTGDEVSPDLTRLMRSSTAVGKIAGVAMRNSLISHFRAKNAKPNRLGGQRTNFWLAVGNTCSAPAATGGKVVVSIRHPHVTAHVYGTTIKPKKARMLAIPVAAEGHGKSPRSISGLRCVYSGKRPVALALDGKTIYVLKMSQRIPKDPTALPPDERVVAAVDRAVGIWMARQRGGMGAH